MNTCQNGYMQSRSQGRRNNPSYMPARNDNSCDGMRSENSCGCNAKSNYNSPCMNDPLSMLPVAMAYVPWQCWKDLYDLDKALEIGTIFEELNKPFLGRRCGR